MQVMGKEDHKSLHLSTFQDLCRNLEAYHSNYVGFAERSKTVERSENLRNSAEDKDKDIEECKW